MSKPNLSRAIQDKLKWTRVRQKAWRDKPDHMEAIRVRATQRAATSKARNHLALIRNLSTLPASLSTDELQAIVKAASTYRGTYHSFQNRLRRHGLMRYDAASGRWLNLCHVFLVA